MGASRRYRKRIRQSPTLFVLPGIGDDLPVELKDALAVRNATDMNGCCPRCGAEPEREDGTPFDGTIEVGTVTHLYFRHEFDCPASDASIRDLLANEGKAS